MTLDADKKQRAQELFWEIRRSEADGVPAVGLRHLHAELAPLHGSIALLDLDSAMGTWPDLFAAITSFAWAGNFDRARELIDQGRKHCLESSRMCDELARLQTWMDGIPWVDEYQRQFAELAVGRSLGTLTPDEQGAREHRLVEILARLPREHVESLLRWRDLQTRPAPVATPDRLDLVEAEDPSASPMQCANRHDPPRSKTMTKVGDWAFSFDEESYSDETFATRQQCVAAARDYGRSHGHEQPRGEVVAYVGRVTAVFTIGGCYRWALDVRDLEERAEDYLYEETLCEEPSSRLAVEKEHLDALQKKLHAVIDQWSSEHGFDKPCYYMVGMSREIDATDPDELDRED